MYPDDCIQTYTQGWWTEDTSQVAVRGRLLWTWVPYPEMKPYRLVPIGRGSDPRQHGRAEFRIETFRMGDPPLGISTLPVAALPIRDGETLFVQRGKRRPAVVISTGGARVVRELRAGQARWQSAPTLLVAPFYGADPGVSRGGWPKPFVDRIRRAEYPQYVWDELPDGGTSILRLDHVFAIGADPANFDVTSHVLTSEAMTLLDDWLTWLHTGVLGPETGLAYARAGIEELLR